ncbi:MAG TPA: DegT/DnrJ/EryC1/StrS family aminotransferase [Gammaproteobacteria bacterium]|nr:DegT/DnrJ/EryC1/StrS family aminotransferase [Gammaproteobacteria bacterium]
MQVPLLDLKGQYAPLRAEIETAIKEVCDEQRFVLGPRVAELEAKVAEYCQTKHGLGLSSGTDALLLALMALDIGPGDEVITTPFTFFATAGVVARLGARPFFCDIDAATFNLDPAAVEQAIAERCELKGDRLVNRATGGALKALIPVHLYGQMADLDAFAKIARQYRLAIVEDAAQAIGAALADGRRAGSVGDVGCLSFFPTKNLGAFGDAGMNVTNDAALQERMRILRVHGGEPKYYHSVIGGNFRLDELQAAVLVIKLKHLDDWTRARQANAARYDELFRSADLGAAIKPPTRVAGSRHIFNQYVIRTRKRDELRAHLVASGVGTEIYYPVPLHAQRCFAYLEHDPSDFPQAQKAASEVLALPIYPELTPEQLEYVVRQIAAFYHSGRH